MSQCIICEANVAPFNWNASGPGAIVDCPRCGRHRVSELLAQRVFEWRQSPLARPEITQRGLTLASGAIRELVESGREPWVADLQEIAASVNPPRDPLEAIDKLVMFVFRRTTAAGDGVVIRSSTDRSAAYASTDEEFAFLLGQAESLGLLDATSDRTWRLTLDGWQRVRQLKDSTRMPDQAFVAMWFNPELDSLWHDGLKPGVEAAGYRPLRIDMAEHNGKIDDLIIAEIKRSGLVVADFTGQRQSVYFEAGFAYGLGIPVIWTCHRDWIEQAHFDTRQYNHITWTEPSDLAVSLTARIAATLPLRSTFGD